MNKTGKYAVRFLAVPFVTGSILFSTAIPQHTQANTGEFYEMKNTTRQTNQIVGKRAEIGNLQLTVLGLYTFQVIRTEKLSDVEFTVYKKGKVYLKQKTDSNGEISFQLPVGIYTYKQTSERSSDFFVADGTEYSLEIKKDGQLSKHTIYNPYIYF
ncbi:prealbumin-like fold domain-containing protein [Bacillus sp. CDB3]|uniref:prealbumin-like fold domain-containing protein n=1 Tax=Bacillus sp. CDB3 TaxID=360310 RepID=UPI0021187A7E|nr:prealbumin-like fold domain-containing protein [Bacillus sp. CDB3]